MLAESQIKRFIKSENPEEYQKILEFAEKNGHTANVTEDSIILDSIPAEYQPFIDQTIKDLSRIGQTNPFKYFILSGFHDLRYRGHEMLLSGIYELDEEAYKKAVEEQ